MSALGSLLANYTDSEDEDQNKEEDDDEETTRDSVTFPSGPPSHLTTHSASGTPNSSKSATPGGGGSSKPKGPPNLVSDYGDIQDDNDDKDTGAVPMDLESDEESKEQPTEQSKDDILNRSGSVIEVDAWTEGGKLPPEPQGLCSLKIQEAVTKAYKRKQENPNYDMNFVIQRKKGFRNPSIYEKLIQFCEIDEHGTNFPKDLYDGHLFGKESYYDELAKVQKADMERREKAAKERNNAKISSDHQKKDEPKRKSKWDQVGPSNVPVVRATAPTTSASKTSIPAFGALKK